MENFDQMAESYDTENRIQRAELIAEKIRTHITCGSGKTAMEFGCGTGLVGLSLSGVFEKLLLVDSSSEMIKQVEAKLTAFGKPAAHHTSEITVLCCDLLQEIPENLKVDYIFSSLVLHHIEDTPAALQVFNKLLNDGGRLIIVDIDKEDGGFHAGYADFDGHNGFEQSELAELTVAAGFRAVEIETFHRDVKTHEGTETPYTLFILTAEKSA
ncbi:MAG: methyltransferase domain-containing protein [Oscillospiraceae bacterium]|nr:methyltransferase domain-containing protein [Oscillospiraceae bacterium]